MEEWIGCIFVSAFVFIFWVVLAEKLAQLLKLKPFREKCNNVQIYLISIIIFIVITSLLFFALIYEIEKLPKHDIVESGLVLTISTVLCGRVIRFIYYIASKFFKLYPLYEEIKWTFIFMCLGFSLLCYTQGINLYCYTFLALAIGKVFWFDFNKETILEEILSLKKLPSTYFYSLAFIIESIFCSIRYSKNIVLWGSSMVGLFIGVFIVILFSAYKEKYK